MKYVRNQNINLSFILTLDNDLHPANAISITIESRSPSGKMGSWNVSEPLDSDTINYEILANTLKERGIYYIWPKLVFSETEIYFGAASVLKIVDPWENL